MKIILHTAVVAILVFLLPVSNHSAQTVKGANAVQNGSTVSVEYTLSDEKGKVIESNKGKEPLKYTHGQNQMISGFEKELAGMKVGGQKRFRLKPEDGYGPVDPKAFREVPKAELPPEALKVGTTLIAKDAQGLTAQVKVHQIREKTVVMDMNHPLAGKTLVYDVKVLDITATATK